MKNTDQIPMDFRDFLEGEYLRRCKKNPKYSLRNFAQFLDLDHSSLSKIFRKRRQLSKRLVLKVCERLAIKSDITEKFLAEMESHESTLKQYEQMSLDTYKTISQWFHFAILELVTVKNFNSSPKNVAQMLSISLDEAKSALDRLTRLKLLEEDANGKLVRTNNFLTTTGHNFTNDALKIQQNCLLDRSKFALQKIPFERRDHSSMTMAINSSRLPEAKRRIKNFRRALCEDLQTESSRDSVYQLLVSFFPLTTCPGEET